MTLAGRGSMHEDNKLATLDKVSLDIQVVLGTTMMPVHQVLRLGRGAIIELEASENDEVEIRANSFPVAYTHFTEDAERRSVTGRMSKDEARWIAINIGAAPELRCHLAVVEVHYAAGRRRNAMPKASGSEAARAALAQYRLATGTRDATGTTITDLLTDLMHLAIREGLDPAELTEQARRHFLVEVHQERQAA